MSQILPYALATSTMLLATNAFAHHGGEHAYSGASALPTAIVGVLALSALAAAVIIIRKFRA